MSFSQKLLDGADLVSSVTAGVEMIEKITGAALPHNADAVLKVVAVIAKTIKQALDGHYTGPDLLNALNTLRDGLAANDATAQSELDKKFPT